MTSPLRNLALSLALIAVPAGGFALAEAWIAPASAPAAATASAAPLGDMSAYQTIVTDTQRIAATGDLTAAETRLTDLEALWDQNASALRAMDANAWGTIDGAADDAFAALRARTPDAARVTSTLTALQEALANPVSPGAQGGVVQMVSGIAVTDASGRALPCETLIGQLRTELAGRAAPSGVADLQARALERCNADDDAHSDAFAAQALAQLRG
ncbi:hypothetical protein JI664_10745 [Rhodobacter sp. NTK016B]|uniref:hypothetical protein n=1 Tax=Rhodobacter sp. NTK016B TaxID=2759676 RepID=UPI001A8E6D69|nr:hypothetical protein [Rhodobacter sp. NTK016B]MBN8292444.1 hypothetical protein [Rhodobacter sp. NTK016B]